MMGTCKLCGEQRQLKKSHIIPRSYYRSAKRGQGQLIKIKDDQDTAPMLINSDPKEPLLCQDCEQFLSDNYEREGTRLFKPSRDRRHQVVRMGEYVKFKGFKYRLTYLYFLSILWRAAVSRLPQYAGVELAGIEPYVRDCLRRKHLDLNPQIRIDHFIKLGIVRVVDRTGAVPDSLLKGAILDMNRSLGKPASTQGALFYFMVDGFLIVYVLKPEPSLEQLRTARFEFQVPDRSSVKIRFLDIQEVAEISNVMATAIRKAQEHPEAGPQ